MTLQDNIRCLRGVGEQRAKAFEKAGISTLRDLLSYFPRAYEDRRSICPIMQAPQDMPVCIRAMAAADPTLAYVRRGMQLVKLRAVDDSGMVDITWFNQAYLKNALHQGETYIFYGYVTASGTRRTMANPAFEREDRQGIVTGRIYPIYRIPTGLTQRLIMESIESVLEQCGSEIPDILPDDVRRKNQLAQIRYAYENIHLPRDDQALDKARERLVYEELFVLSTALSGLREKRRAKPGIRLTAQDMAPFWDGLSFAPTGAQRRAVDEALRDMASGSPMSRLLQGDVGSGKTLVAAALIWQAAKNGIQCAFMAPTEVLANQHFATLSGLLEPYGIRVIRLTGSMTAAEKRAAVKLLAEGEADLAVGTHALISESVQYKNLGLVVTDEQHRFGVDQRSALVEKGVNPHLLVMSATPIPRTLSLVIYGDLEVSILDEMPPGRKKIDTFHVDESMRERINKFIRKLVAEGRQVFIVCPMVEENEELPGNLKSAEVYAKQLQEEIFPDLRVLCVHGRMKPKAKDAVMADFAAGKADILVATTVIEVGVDIPNAALMIVENAERFGLSQLHQLRGRVGRGQFKSYCVLFSDAEGETAKSRLKIMEKTNDGFKIAEEDLRLRGPGDFFGTRQHGLPEMHVADLSADMRVLKQAQSDAQETLAADPDLSLPEHRALKQHIDRLFTLNADKWN